MKVPTDLPEVDEGEMFLVAFLKVGDLEDPIVFSAEGVESRIGLYEAFRALRDLMTSELLNAREDTADGDD